MSDYVKWRALAGPRSRNAAGRRAPFHVALAVACFAVVLAAIAIAIVIIAGGGH